MSLAAGDYDIYCDGTVPGVLKKPPNNDRKFNH